MEVCKGTSRHDLVSLLQKRALISREDPGPGQEGQVGLDSHSPAPHPVARRPPTRAPQADGPDGRWFGRVPTRKGFGRDLEGPDCQTPEKVSPKGSGQIWQTGFHTVIRTKCTETSMEREQEGRTLRVRTLRKTLVLMGFHCLLMGFHYTSDSLGFPRRIRVNPCSPYLTCSY